MEPLKPSSLIGLSKDEALRRIKLGGMVHRVTLEDGKYFVGTDEINVNRVNLELKKGVVVNASFG